ncbi:class I SAM-dependent methyltransferase [Bacillus sonorensis]|uniref:Methyltransferase YodH n=2 Tax=Bacillus sonorensis TaxID=119858 RepID=M5PA58_9BACI|nr:MULTISPECIES: class I SAM-dependent methyltransferase [Bacillus]TWK82426.1 Phthiotriol/phenolphthiotriol dimycocerosates methyltransferase [Bacillus paralicheniformis]ASB88832.1 putative methyltransferase YodH [Bacillus sonorensis]EME76358.1 methyltransferase YodH [Bacillus sonorensis L12]MBG9915372.1 SAM-dependent methyltransferase [Bacillus sonorensis]MCF7618187.1 class I SAM-dependent methyltransferase [Bacillus sonorensis]
MSDYLDMLAYFGVSGAHPGGMALTKAVLAKADIDPERPILDAGCGTGQTAAYLGQLLFSVTALDSDAVMLDKAKKRFADEGLSIPVVHTQIEETPFQPDSFGYVLSESVLSFTHLDLSLAEIRRILEPDGKLICIEVTLADDSLSKEEKQEICDFYGFTALYTKDEWMGVLREGGFSQIEIISSSLEETDIDEAVTEMDLSEVIPEKSYQTMEKHQRLLAKYQDSLHPIIFVCGQ